MKNFPQEDKRALALAMMLVMLCMVGNARGQIFGQMVHDEIYKVTSLDHDKKRDADAKISSTGDKEKKHLVKRHSRSSEVVVMDKVRGWRKNITATIFWVGENACPANPVHNHSSSWDKNWVLSYGGIDSPWRRRGYKPKGFSPRMNPFYVALPYNDISPHGLGHKSEAAKVIWWYKREFKTKYRSVCKGRWIAIRKGDKVCYAQWEDCGPFETNDWAYVFQGKKPKKNKNGNAGIDLSPAIRDYLGVRSGGKVSWKFVEQYEVESGPWSQWLSYSGVLTSNP